MTKNPKVEVNIPQIAQKKFAEKAQKKFEQNKSAKIIAINQRKSAGEKRYTSSIE